MIDKYLPDEVRTLKTAGELPGEDSCELPFRRIKLDFTVLLLHPSLKDGRFD